MLFFLSLHAHFTFAEPSEASLPLASLASLDSEDATDMTIDITTIAIRFGVPLLECCIKAIMVTLGKLKSYQTFTFNLTNIMSTAPKDIDIGYTLPWNKIAKKDINSGRAILVLDGENALQDLGIQIEQYIVAEYQSRLKKAWNGKTQDMQSIADGYMIPIYNLKDIRKNIQMKSQPRSSLVSFYYYSMILPTFHQILE